MAKRISKQMLTCSVSLSAKQALALRDLGVSLEYRCPNKDCDQPVFPVSKGKDNTGHTDKAHFKHKNRTRKCPYGVGYQASVAPNPV
jgi:hypothetical protein